MKQVQKCPLFAATGIFFNILLVAGAQSNISCTVNEAIPLTSVIHTKEDTFIYIHCSAATTCFDTLTAEVDGINKTNAIKQSVRLVNGICAGSNVTCINLYAYIEVNEYLNNTQIKVTGLAKIATEDDDICNGRSTVIKTTISIDEGPGYSTLNNCTTETSVASTTTRSTERDNSQEGYVVKCSVWRNSNATEIIIEPNNILLLLCKKRTTQGETVYYNVGGLPIEPNGKQENVEIYSSENMDVCAINKSCSTDSIFIWGAEQLHQNILKVCILNFDEDKRTSCPISYTILIEREKCTNDSETVTQTGAAFPISSTARVILLSTLLCWAFVYKFIPSL